MKRSLAPDPHHDMMLAIRDLIDRPQPAPEVTVTVEAPKPHVEMPHRPKQFEVEVTERDARGAIKKLIVKEMCDDC